jgi:hypothetical protein
MAVEPMMPGRKPCSYMVRVEQKKPYKLIYEQTFVPREGYDAEESATRNFASMCKTWPEYDVVLIANYADMSPVVQQRMEP